jgi:DNA invertase Pin-like site-specific DNA recombinase
MNNIINVAAYCRVSTDEADQLHSLSSQIKYFTDYISQHEGWRLKEVYYDEGISGTSVKKRISFNRMIADAENKEMDLILTKEVSRFARNTVDTLTFTRRLSSINVGVIFTNDNIDTRDKDGELRLTIMASIAQEESRKTSERCKWGLRRKMENGVVLGSKVRFGYRTIDGILTIVPEEAETLRRIYNAYAYENKSSYKIASELNDDRKFTVSGCPWTGSKVLKTLKCEIYVGDLVQGKRYVSDFLTKTYSQSSEDMIVTVRDHHEAIIDRKTWESTQKILAERGAMAAEGRRHSTKHWHSGKIKCGVCGRAYILNSNGVSKTLTLCCENRRSNGTELKVADNGKTYGCANNGMNEQVLMLGMECILKHIGHTRNEVINDLLREIKTMQKKSETVDVSSLEAEIKNLETKKRNAIDLLLEGLISKDDLKKQTEFYDSEIVRLNDEIYQSQNVSLVHERQIRNVKNYIAKVKETAGISEYNSDIYSTVLERVMVNNNCTADFYLNCVPFGFRIVYHTETKKRKFNVYVDSCVIIE